MRFFLFISLTLAALLSSSVHASSFERLRILMGDVPVRIVIATRPKHKLKAWQAMEAAYAEAVRLENIFSEFIATSEISRLHHASAQRWLAVSDELWDLLQAAHQISAQTLGDFDITFAAPNPQIHFHTIEFHPQNHSVRWAVPGLQIRLTGIAKGAIVDAMASPIKKAGFKHFIIKAGGDIWAQGKWPVEIFDPRQKLSPPLPILNLKNQAVATSGLYERGNHIVDPHSRKKVQPAYLSVTVIAPSSTLADALATAAFVSGPARTRAWIASFPMTKIIFVFANRWEEINTSF